MDNLHIYFGSFAVRRIVGTVIKVMYITVHRVPAVIITVTS